jgi:UDP-N-acetylglucosamine 2-epimerase
MGIKKPDFFLNAAADNPALTIGNVIAKSDELFEQIKPDAVLLYGDTNSCLSVIPAKRRKIPVFHMEAGNRCFDQRVPEEINRKIVDSLSDINMTLTEHARRYLIDEGVRPETVIKTGSSMKEVLNYHQSDINKSNVLNRLNLEKNDFFIVSIHREENVDSPKNFTDLLNSLNAIADKYGKRVIVSTHPRTRKKLETIDSLEFNQLIEFMKPLGFFDYIALQKSAFCAISDSGTITEESPILGFPAITIRQAHERPEGMDEGTLIMSGLKHADVINSIDIVTGQYVENNYRPNIVSDYDVDDVSQKVVRIIVSYTDYIRRSVWKEY